jgi:DNA-binding transcriptional regulator YiaG
MTTSRECGQFSRVMLSPALECAPTDHFREFSPELATSTLWQVTFRRRAVYQSQRALHFYADQWHVEHVTDLRLCRRQLGLTQDELAGLLSVPRNSLRMWDSGLRQTPREVLDKARVAAAEAVEDQQPLTLPGLATKLNVHVRTLQAAARTGRLEVQYSEQSVFGRPRRHSTLAAGKAFLRTYYKRFSGQPVGRFAVPARVPRGCGRHLRMLRRRLKISQNDLAELIGAANKAVVYQWESGKRTPSPVFWERVLTLARVRPSQRHAVPLRLDKCARSSVG